MDGRWYWTMAYVWCSPRMSCCHEGTLRMCTEAVYTDLCHSGEYNLHSIVFVRIVIIVIYGIVQFLLIANKVRVPHETKLRWPMYPASDTGNKLDHTRAVTLVVLAGAEKTRGNGVTLPGSFHNAWIMLWSSNMRHNPVVYNEICLKKHRPKTLHERSIAPLTDTVTYFRRMSLGHVIRHRKLMFYSFFFSQWTRSNPFFTY